MEKSIISIIVPIYKVERELERCVNSLISQTYKELEIILVDDGSPDKCPQLCDWFSEKDKRIKVIHKENGGLSDARNEGLKIATGKYVLYVDSDDYLELDACERFIYAADGNDVDFVVGVCKEIREGDVGYQKHSNISNGEVLSSREFVIKSIEANEWYAPAWLNMYNRQFLLDNSLFFKKGYVFEDMEMLPRLLLVARNVKYLDYPFYNYVIRQNSITSSSISEEKISSAINIYTGWKNMFDNIEDEEYKRYLYGVLIKYYLTTCRNFKISGWKVEGMNLRFGLKYALNVKERLKVILFTLAPNLYMK